MYFSGVQNAMNGRITMSFIIISRSYSEEIDHREWVPAEKYLKIVNNFIKVFTSKNSI